MHVRYITHSGDDLTVVNAARVSFDKESEYELLAEPPFSELKEKDVKLINYLAKHGHWTPFAHPTITLVLKAPIFVARQAMKHQVGFVVNEVSRRYVDSEPEFYRPNIWRERAEDKKQGSTNVQAIVDEADIKQWYDDALNIYDFLLNEAGVCPEQARMVLPQSMYTSWYWTGSLAAWARFYKLRSEETAQKEIQELADMVLNIIAPLYPVSWEVLTNDT